MVQIEQRSLRALEQDVFAASQHFLDELRRVGQMRLESSPPLRRQRDQLIQVEAFDSMLALQRGVLLRQDSGQFASERGSVEKVFHSDADAPGAVGVGRPDAATRGPHGRLGESGFHRSVQGDVVGHDHVGVLADANPVHLDAATREHVQFGDESGRVDHDPVADDRRDVRIQHTGRDEVELEDLLAEHDGVTGVVTALISDDGCDVGCQSIGCLAFALVSPLQADYHRGGHLRIPFALAPAVSP